MNQPDWSLPQRQPIAGLVIVFLNTFWEVLKRMWPFILVFLFRDGDGSVNRYEIVALIFLCFTVISAVLNFVYFKFYIEDEKLIIKKGWFKKETKVIPLDKIQTVHIEQGLMHQVLNIVKLSIDTAGSEKAEAKIDALHKTMAEALRQQLIEGKENQAISENPAAVFNDPIIRLTGRDLLKLSISANHLEAFFLLLSFGIGLYQNLKDIDNSLFSGMQDLFPDNSLMPVLALAVLVLFITILVSTARIVFTFYDLKVFETDRGFHIQSGLTIIKQRLIGIRKIQYLTWRANWIRKLMRLWLMEFHVSGSSDLKNKLKVQVPVTQTRFIPILANGYHPLPEIGQEVAIRMHRSFIVRRLLIAGILPALIVIPALWLLWENLAFVYLLVPLAIGVVAWCSQIKFRLWALNDVLYIKKGIFGEERILLRWFKMQSIEVRQSIFQRRTGLADLVIHTAGGNIVVYFISIEAALQVMNYSLYKTEASAESWI